MKNNKFKNLSSIYIAVVVFILLLIATNSITAQADSKILTIKYHGIRPDDPGGRSGLRNPERGFRHESFVGLPPGDNMWGIGDYLKGRATSGFSDDWFLMNARRYEADGITLLQAYCYLTDYYDKPISEEKLALLQRSLNRVREAGLKVLLRFVYEKSMKREQGPTIETILKHIDQLAPIIQHNKDIIYVLQAGFVGAWGEWHSSANYLEEDHFGLAAIIAKELEVLPKDRMIQLRVMPKYKRWVLEDPVINSSVILDSANAFTGVPAARLGFADDGFLANKSDGGTWTEPPFYANPGNPEFDIVTKESPYMAVDGELFWSDQGGKIDGLRAASRLRLHHFTSFSITHSYSGYEGKRYSIDRWMETPLAEEEVRNENLPISDGYFRNYEGKPVERTEFEYIRDHLGYRIELQNASFQNQVSSNESISVKVELINRGFATFINPRPVYFVLINTSGEFVLKQKTDADPQTWQPFNPGDLEYKPLTHSIKGNISLTEIKGGEYMLGLWMPDADESIRLDSRYAVRTANRDTPWWTTADGKYGVNILGTVKVSAK
ncbi:MAG: DUF4832 domain-containing protein [Chlorobi bacterium]|nr:DUF4832 domain-containing protein [Chlorobiota bacterium]